MTERGIVCDTNVIVSALLMKQSTARRAFDKALSEGTLLLSAASLAELNDVLKREKFNKYLRPKERLQFLTAFVRVAKVIEIHETISACRDPKDDKFLEVAVNGKAACIISGDHDLLVLHPFRGIAIMTPHAFLQYVWI